MSKNIDLHRLAETVGWQATYVDEGYTGYEYVQKIKNIESLCHVLKIYDDLTYESYEQTFEAIISVLPKELYKKIKKLTKKSDPENIGNIIDLVCYEVEAYRKNTMYNKLYTYGMSLGIDITEHGYLFDYALTKSMSRQILSMIESYLPIDLAPVLGKIKKIDYKIGYVKQHGIKI